MDRVKRDVFITFDFLQECIEDNRFKGSLKIQQLSYQGQAKLLRFEIHHNHHNQHLV